MSQSKSQEAERASHILKTATVARASYVGACIAGGGGKGGKIATVKRLLAACDDIVGSVSVAVS